LVNSLHLPSATPLSPWLVNSLHLPSATPVSLIVSCCTPVFSPLYIVPVFPLSPVGFLSLSQSRNVSVSMSHSQSLVAWWFLVFFVVAFKPEFLCLTFSEVKCFLFHSNLESSLSLCTWASPRDKPVTAAIQNVASQRMWLQFRRHFGLRPASGYFPAVNNQSYSSSVLDNAFQHWQTDGWYVNICVWVKLIFNSSLWFTCRLYKSPVQPEAKTIDYAEQACNVY